jgi:hypothetical protein
MVARRLPEFSYTDNQNLESYLHDLVRLLHVMFDEFEEDINQKSVTEKHGYRTLTESQNMPRDVSIVLCDATSGPITITLPDPYEAMGETYYIKKINTGANNVTIEVEGGGHIDTITSYSLIGAARPSVKIFSDGTEYWVI